MRQLIVILAILGAAQVAPADEKSGVHWPQFRGPSAGGVAEGFATPDEWDIDSGKGVKWKTAVPGLGLSSPVIWGDRVFITTAVGEKGDASLRVGLYGDIQPVNEDFAHKFQVVCLDKKSGKILWTQTAYDGVPKVKRHTKASHANASVATDGKRVVAFFGSEGLYCYDMDGKPLWKKDFGLLDSAYYAIPTAQWGFASSPVIFEDRVIVLADVLKGSFVAALGLDDGRELWRTERSDVPTWSSPTVHRGSDRTQVLCNGYREMAGYDVATGKKLWEMEGGGDIPVPTPVVAGELAYFASAHGAAAPIFAIRTSAAGDVERPEPGESNASVAWHKGQVGVYMQTLLAHNGIVYGCRDNGILVALDATTGEQLYKERVGTGKSGFTASMVAADGKLYVTSEDGDVYIVKLGRKFERVGMSPLNEICMATPAISEGTLFFRTRGHVVAIGK